MRIEFTCYKAYKEKQAGFDFFSKLCAGEFVVVEIIEASVFCA